MIASDKRPYILIFPAFDRMIRSWLKVKAVLFYTILENYYNLKDGIVWYWIFMSHLMKLQGIMLVILCLKILMIRYFFSLWTIQ